MRAKDYIKKFRKVISSRVKGTKLLPSIIAAHAIYEAAGDDGLIGTSLLATEHKNDVRLLADKSWQGKKVLLPVRHFTRHKELVRKTWFRKYSDSQDAIKDRIEMLIGKVERWPTSLLHHETVKLQATILQMLEAPGNQYYAKKIIEIIEKFKLYRLDRQWWIQSTMESSAYFLIGGLAIQQWDNWVPWRQDWFINLFQ